MPHMSQDVSQFMLHHDDIKLDADDLKPLKNYLPIETLLKGSKELHIPAKDNFIYRY